MPQLLVQNEPDEKQKKVKIEIFNLSFGKIGICLPTFQRNFAKCFDFVQKFEHGSFI